MVVVGVGVGWGGGGGGGGGGDLQPSKRKASELLMHPISPP